MEDVYSLSGEVLHFAFAQCSFSVLSLVFLKFYTIDVIKKSLWKIHIRLCSVKKEREFSF